jgi:hypothetical protein
LRAVFPRYSRRRARAEPAVEEGRPARAHSQIAALDTGSTITATAAIRSGEGIVAPGHESAADNLVRCVGLLYADHVPGGNRHFTRASWCSRDVLRGDLSCDAMGFAWLTNHLFS